METKDAAILVGEVHCINCGRTLGELMRDAASDRLRLRAALNQSQLLVRLHGRTLRCQRCRGRAFVEPCEPVTITTGERASVSPLRGAA